MDEFTKMEYQDGLTTLKNLPNRVFTLLWKILGWKGILLSLTFVLTWFGKVPEGAVGYVWLLTMVLILFGEKGLDFVKEIKK